MAQRTCSIPGCGKTGKLTRGWCSKHYTSWQRHGDPLATTKAKLANTPAVRFAARVVAGDGCWGWLGTIRANGYATFTIDRRPVLAHRWSYEHYVGPIPDRLHIDHLCRNRSCTNPAHLEPVTPYVNTHRSPISPGALNAKKTHCPQGHPYDEANTYVNPNNGRRACRTCQHSHNKRWRSRRAGAFLTIDPV